MKVIGNGREYRVNRVKLTGRDYDFDGFEILEVGASIDLIDSVADRVLGYYSTEAEAITRIAELAGV